MHRKRKTAVKLVLGFLTLTLLVSLATPNALLGTLNDELDREVFLPVVFGPPPVKLPGHPMESGALDLRGVGAQGVAGFAEGVSRPTARGQWEEKLASMRANGSPEVVNHYATEEEAKQAVDGQIGTQGWSGLNFGDPDEQVGAYWNGSHWVLPSGAWINFPVIGDPRKEGNLFRALLQYPSGSTQFSIWMIDRSTDQYGGTINQGYAAGGWVYVFTHFVWFDEDPRDLVLSLHNSGSGEIVIHDLYGLTTDTPEDFGGTWEPTFISYESGYRVCAWSGEEQEHRHCAPRDAFFVPTWGDVLKEAQFQWVTSSELAATYPPPGGLVKLIGITAAGEGEGDDVVIQQGATLVIVPFAVGILVIAGVTYYVVTADINGEEIVFYFPLDLDSFGEPGRYPSGVKVFDDFVIGLLLTAPRTYLGLRDEVFTRYHEWYFERVDVSETVRVRDFPYPAPPLPWAPFEEIGETWIPTTHTEVFEGEVTYPDPQDSCGGKYNFNPYRDALRYAVDDSDPENPIVVVSLHEDGVETSRAYIGRTEEGIYRYTETKPEYKRAGRATYLMAVSLIIYSREMRARGLFWILDEEPFIPADLHGYDYHCITEWLVRMYLEGYIDLALERVGNAIDLEVWLYEVR